MSAFIVSPQHIGALAAFAVLRQATSGQVHDMDKISAVTHIASMLAIANVASVNKRYGLASDAFQLASDATKFAKRYLTKPFALSTMDYYKMADCLDYQSCEVSGWHETDACKQLDRIKHKAVMLMQGYDEATWDFNG
jgi:hypothetical protein